MQSTILNYEDIRGLIKNGDVLLYRGTGIFSRAIIWASKRKIKLEKRHTKSHIEFAAWWDDKRLMALGAVGSGVRPAPLSNNVKNYHGTVELYKADLSDVQREIIMEYALAQLGKKYPRIKKMIKLGWMLITGKSRNKRDEYREANEIKCSHYVSAGYNLAGADPKKGISDEDITPSEIAQSKVFKKVGIIKLEAI